MRKIQTEIRKKLSTEEKLIYLSELFDLKYFLVSDFLYKNLTNEIGLKNFETILFEDPANYILETELKLVKNQPCLAYLDWSRVTKALLKTFSDKSPDSLLVVQEDKAHRLNEGWVGREWIVDRRDDLVLLHQGFYYIPGL